MKKKEIGKVRKRVGIITFFILVTSVVFFVLYEIEKMEKREEELEEMRLDRFRGW